MALWLAKLIERPTNKGRAVVKGKRVNRGAGYGLEIPCEYHFTGTFQLLKFIFELSIIESRSDIFPFVLLNL